MPPITPCGQAFGARWGRGTGRGRLASILVPSSPGRLTIIALPSSRLISANLTRSNLADGDFCQRSAGCPRWRPRGFPMNGHENSPRAAMVFPGCGVCGLGGQGCDSFAAGGIGETDGCAFGEHEVGVVHEPVDERGGDGSVHELVEPGGVQVRGHGD